jgi:ubiquinone/menaquinone biosynthesis C-methylase UbiE
MKKLYSQFFARVYDPFMHQIEERFFSLKRKKFLHLLHGRILDVGSGTGANFPHFSKFAQVTAVEPNQKMLEISQSKLPVDAQIDFVVGGIGQPHVNFPDHHFDFIVCTLVLCTIPQPELALKHFKKWLKPDGKLILIEHIRSHTHVHGKIQDIINPVWKLAADGCNLNRDTHKMVLNAGFIPEKEDYFKLGFRWLEGIYRIK